MTGILAIGWSAGEGAARKDRAAGPTRGACCTCIAAAAAVLVRHRPRRRHGAERLRVEDQRQRRAQRSGAASQSHSRHARPWSAPTPARPTPIRAPSTIGKQRRQLHHRSGALVHRPLPQPDLLRRARRPLVLGGRAGVMVDFIHSKAIARQDEEAAFSGTRRRQAAAAARARLRRSCQEARVLARPQHAAVHRARAAAGHRRRAQPLRGPRRRRAAAPHRGRARAGKPPRAPTSTTMRARQAQALFGLEVRLVARVVLRRVQIHVCGLRRAAVADERKLALAPTCGGSCSAGCDGEEPAGGHITTKIVSHQVVGGLLVRIASHAAAP